MLRPSTVLVRVALAAVAALVAACTGTQYFLANAPTAFGGFDRKADLRYGEDPRQRMDVYSPRAAANLPVVIFWYGGSWLDGRKSNYRFVGAALAKRGFVVAIPDYRLYPAVKFPAFLDDAAQAVVWMQTHAAEFGGDPKRIVLMGHSAGAHMAAFLAFNHEFLARAGAQPQSIQGLIGLSGPYALDPNSDILRTIFAAPYSKADWQPVHFVDERSPPTLLFHGAKDTVVEVGHTEALRDALRARHVRVEVEILPNRGHVDTVAAFALGARHRAPVLERAVEFIDSVSAERASAEPLASLPSSLSALPRLSSAPRAAALDPRTGPSP